ncbi:hypothetical protein PMAYCL1PPCAC_25425, partial [Pristionchus mayeri]
KVSVSQSGVLVNHETFEKNIVLTCGIKGRGYWRCKAVVEWEQYRSADRNLGWYRLINKEVFDFNVANRDLVIKTSCRMGCINPLESTHYDTIVHEFRIKIIESELPPIIDLAKFCPSGMGNVTL